MVLYGGVETGFCWPDHIGNQKRCLLNSMAMCFSRAKSVRSCTTSNQASLKLKGNNDMF